MTFSICLAYTLAAGFHKPVLLKFARWDGTNFVLLFFPLLKPAGALIPVALKKFFSPELARWAGLRARDVFRIFLI